MSMKRSTTELIAPNMAAQARFIIRRRSVFFKRRLCPIETYGCVAEADGVVVAMVVVAMVVVGAATNAGADGATDDVPTTRPRKSSFAAPTRLKLPIVWDVGDASER